MKADKKKATGPQRGRLFSLADRKITTKIALGFSTVLAVLLALSGLAYYGLDRIDFNVRRFTREVGVDATTRDIERDFLWMRRIVREFGVTGDERLLDEGRAQRQTVANEIKASLRKIDSPEHHAKLEQISIAFEAYGALFDRIVMARRELDRLTKDVVNPTGHQARLEADKIEAWAARDGANAILAGEIMKNVLQVRLNAYKTLALHDKSSADTTAKYFDKLGASLAALAARTNGAEIHKHIEDVGALTQQFYDGFNLAERQSREIETLLDGAALNAGRALTADVAEIRNSGQRQEKQIENDTDELIAASQRLLIGLSALGLLIGAALAMSIARAISAPVKQMTQAMTSLASGRLDVEVPARGDKDEIGEMADAVQVFKNAAIAKLRRDAETEEERVRHEQEQRRAEEEAIRHERELVASSIGAGLAKLSAKDLTYRMTDEVPEAYRRLQSDFNSAVAQLEAALANVARGTQAIGSGASQIAVSADDLSKRTEQQAASLEETAAALEQITVTVKSSAEGAAHANDIVGATKSEAEKSGAIVRQAVDAMGRIERSSLQIGQIIGVIDEIAFQTNLLALNAGVEAARAGDAGKGFAVVASEVRALAQRSAEAAKEIKALISASSSEVEQGVELVDQTGKALEKIVAQVAEIDRVVADIANGAREQATSLGEINTAVGQMDQNTQKNAAMVEETTAASHNLRRETEELLRSVGSFRIDAHVIAKSAGAHRLTTRPALEQVAGPGGGSAVRRLAAEADTDSWEEF